MLFRRILRLLILIVVRKHFGTVIPNIVNRMMSNARNNNPILFQVLRSSPRINPIINMAMRKMMVIISILSPYILFKLLDEGWINIF